MEEPDEGFWRAWPEWFDPYEVTDGYTPHGPRLEQLTNEERLVFNELLRLHRRAWFEPSDPILATEGDQVISSESFIQDDIVFEHVLLMLEAARDSRVHAVAAAIGLTDRPSSHDVTVTLKVTGDVARIELVEHEGAHDV